MSEIQNEESMIATHENDMVRTNENRKQNRDRCTRDVMNIENDQKYLDKKFENTLSTLIDRKDNNFAIKKERLILHQWSLYAKRRK